MTGSVFRNVLFGTVSDGLSEGNILFEQILPSTPLIVATINASSNQLFQYRLYRLLLDLDIIKIVYKFQVVSLLVVEQMKILVGLQFAHKISYLVIWLQI